MLRAIDLMTPNVLTVAPETTVAEVIDTLLEHRFSGAPVTDRNGQILGIISEYQLLEVAFTPELKTEPVSKFMTPDVLTVDEQAPLTEVVSQFVLHRIRRLPVVRHGQLIGTISRRDVLRRVTGRDQVAATPCATC